MREIKFRVWDVEDKRFIEFNKFGFDDGLWYIQEIDEAECEIDPPLFYEQDKAVVMQYTGLKDSHGNGIYEGDILEAVFELIDGELETIIDKGVVVFKDYAFQVQTFEDHHEPLHEWAQLSEELKVIGNIYENPELLPEVPQ